MSHVRRGLTAILIAWGLSGLASAQVAYWEGRAYSPDTYTNMLWHTDGMCVSLRQQIGLPRFNGPGWRAQSEYAAWKQQRTATALASTTGDAPLDSVDKRSGRPTPQAYRLVERTYTEQVPTCSKVCINGKCQWVQTYQTVTRTEQVRVAIKQPQPKAAPEIEQAADGEQSTPADAAEEMVRAGGIGYGDLVVDLGCRGGNLLVAAGRKGAQVVGVEIDPAWALKARKALAEAYIPGTIVEGDMFDFDASRATVVMLYHHDDILERLVAGLSPGTKVVSYGHEPPGIGAQKHDWDGEPIYVGIVPDRLDGRSEAQGEVSILESKPTGTAPSAFIIPRTVFGLRK